MTINNKIKNNFVIWFISLIWISDNITLNKSFIDTKNKKIKTPNIFRYIVSLIVKPKDIMKIKKYNQLLFLER